MPTSYQTRTIPTTNYTLTRIGGAYLTDVLGRYITTVDGDRIVVIVPGGNLPLTTYTSRTLI